MFLNAFAVAADARIRVAAKPLDHFYMVLGSPAPPGFLELPMESQDGAWQEMSKHLLLLPGIPATRIPGVLSHNLCSVYSQ